jgi:hypothetical protein
MELTQEQKELVQGDQGMTGEMLDGTYNPDGEGEHPVFTRTQWRLAVVQENTITGYWDWTAHQIALANNPDPVKAAAYSEALNSQTFGRIKTGD